MNIHNYFCGEITSSLIYQFRYNKDKITDEITYTFIFSGGKEVLSTKTIHTEGIEEMIKDLQGLLNKSRELKND